MAKNKEDLSKVLKAILGSNYVYNSPPTRLQYPCIIYELSDIAVEHADNKKYIKYDRYEIKYIRSKDDKEVISKILDLPTCSFDQEFTLNNLKHTIFRLYW